MKNENKKKWCGSCHNYFDIPGDHCPLDGCMGILYEPGDSLYGKGIAGVIVKGNFIERQLEHFATPLWKIIGAKPNAQEKMEEKIRKARGMSHLDLQRERLAKAPKTYTSAKEKKDLLNGNLKPKPSVASYSKGK